MKPAGFMSHFNLPTEKEEEKRSSPEEKEENDDDVTA